MVMGQAVTSTEVAVIGAGPGGYVAAIRAAQLGFKVMLIDAAGELGGMCLHHGCIPSKALIHVMSVFHETKNASPVGIIANDISLDYAKTQEWKQDVINRLANGIRGICKNLDITIVKAYARFQDHKRLTLDGEGLDFNAVEFRHCVIATGSLPRSLPDVEFGGRILSSKEMLELKEIPQRLVVIGGGYIGIELGVMMRKAGAEVTVIEAGKDILGVVEPDQVDVAKKRLEELGVHIFTETTVEAVEDHGENVVVRAGGQEFQADYALIAIGHKPVSKGLQLDLAGVETDERGFIQVNERLETSAPHIYAIGDCVGGVMLAHKASAQGRIVGEVIAGKKVAFEPQVIPAVIFTDPEIASVGMREAEAREQYGDTIKVGKFPFSALGRALAIDRSEGFVKIIADEHGVILGVHGVGPSVSDYVSEAALAIEMGATAQDLALTIHPHPTLSESLSEAAEVLMGEAIHLYQPK